MSGSNFLKIRESVTFSYLDPDLIKVQDHYKLLDYSGPGIPQYSTTPNGAAPNMPTKAEMPNAMPEPNAQGLKVRLAATHAGILTRNNGFYMPDRMKKGAATFTENYSKPILVHHDDEHSDAIGRVGLKWRARRIIE